MRPLGRVQETNWHVGAQVGSQLPAREALEALKNLVERAKGSVFGDNGLEEDYGSIETEEAERKRMEEALRQNCPETCNE